MRGKGVQRLTGKDFDKLRYPLNSSWKKFNEGRQQYCPDCRSPMQCYYNSELFQPIYDCKHCKKLVLVRYNVYL